MRIVETKVYKFDELSDKAKEKARTWWREASVGDNYFSESVIEDAERIAECFGLDLKQNAIPLHSGKTRMEPAIHWSGFWSQGDGASFEGTLRPRADAIAALKDYAPKDEKLASIAASVQALHVATGGLLVAVIRTSGNYSHEYTMGFDFEYPDEEDESPLMDIVKSGAEEIATEAMRNFARWIYRTLEKEYEYQNGNEQVDDKIRANEYEFEEDGNIA